MFKNQLYRIKTLNPNFKLNQLILLRLFKIRTKNTLYHAEISFTT